MEESIFENSCIYSKQNNLEMQYSAFKNKAVLLSVFSVIYVLMGIGSATIEIELSIIFFVCAFLFLLVFLLPRRAVNINLKRNRDLYGTDTEAEIKFYDDHIFGLNKQSKGENNIKYDRIVKINETKHLYLLWLPRKMAIMVDKNGFTKGTKEDFVKFIKEKTPNAKFKIKM